MLNKKTGFYLVIVLILGFLTIGYYIGTTLNTEKGDSKRVYAVQTFIVGYNLDQPPSIFSNKTQAEISAILDQKMQELYHLRDKNDSEALEKKMEEIRREGFIVAPNTMMRSTVPVGELTEEEKMEMVIGIHKNFKNMSKEEQEQFVDQCMDSLDKLEKKSLDKVE